MVEVVKPNKVESWLPNDSTNIIKLFICHFITMNFIRVIEAFLKLQNKWNIIHLYRPQLA